MIPARRALIGWSYAPNGRTYERVLVIEQDPTKPADYLGPPEWDRAMFTMGACDLNWLKPGCPHQTPAGVFSDMLTSGGFAGPPDVIQALREFSKIASCGWARTMLAVAAPSEQRVRRSTLRRPS